MKYQKTQKNVHPTFPVKGDVFKPTNFYLKQRQAENNWTINQFLKLIKFLLTDLLPDHFSSAHEFAKNYGVLLKTYDCKKNLLDPSVVSTKWVEVNETEEQFHHLTPSINRPGHQKINKIKEKINAHLHARKTLLQ